MAENMKVEYDASELRVAPPVRDIDLAKPLEKAPVAAPPKAEIPKSVAARELESTYQELEKAIGLNQEPDPPAEIQEPTDPVIETNTDFDAFTKEFHETGGLSEDSYKALETKGIPKALVDAFIDGAKAKAKVTQSEYFSMVGGEAEYRKIQEWAATNLNKEERDVYNKAVESGNDAQIRFAIQGLSARFKGNQPQAKKTAVMGNPASGAVKPFSSMNQVVLAMRDPRYQVDEDYRAEVLDRISKSNL